MEKYLGRRYVVFGLSLFVISVGVGVITHGDLGTSPITSVPRSLSMVFPQLTMGNFTIIFLLLMIVLQRILMGRDITRNEKVNLVLEAVVALCFGYLVDFGMWMFSGLHPTAYWEQLVCVIVGILIIAFGVYLQIVANVVMIPVDGFIYALTMRVRKKYSTIRVLSDSTMVVISAVIGLVGIGSLGGVREGTIIACIFTGLIVRRYMVYLAKLTEWLVPGKDLEMLAEGDSEDAVRS